MEGRDITLLDSAGRRLEVELLQEEEDGSLVATGPQGRRLFVPADAIERREGTDVRLSLPLADLASGPAARGEERVVPLAREEAAFRTRDRTAATVRVQTRTSEREEAVEEMVSRETVDVEHVPVGRFVDGPSPVREEGDTTIVPLYEEVLVVEKRLLLREELHLTKRTEARPETHTVRLRSQEAEIERTDPDEA